MLNSGKKFRALRDKKKNSNSRPLLVIVNPRYLAYVVRKKNSERNKKP